MRPKEHFITIGWRLGRRPNGRYPEGPIAEFSDFTSYLEYLKQLSTHLPELPIADVVDRDARNYRVVYISGEAIDKPGYFYRIDRYAKAFSRLGTEVITLPLEKIRSCREEILASNLVIIWRASWSTDIDALIRDTRARAIPTVFDVDDLMVSPEHATAQFIDAIRYDKKDPARVRSHYENVARTMVNCSYGTATTDELAWHMRRNGRRRPTVVLPNGYATNTYALSRISARRKAEHTDCLIRIGYASGSRTHQADFKLCASAVSKALRSNKNCRLVLFKKGDLTTLDLSEFPEMHGLESQIEWRPFKKHAELPTEVARFDVNLAPVEVGNPFCEAKSELKFFEAAICDVPTIASPTGPFSRAIVDGVTGFLADSPDKWENSILNLVSDPSLRTRIGGEAHRAALWPFGPKRRVDLVEALKGITMGGRAASAAFIRYNMDKFRSYKAVHIPERVIIFERNRLRASEATVIIPLHNYETYITEALDSVKSQDLPDIDLIVVDDCSTDRSQAVTRAWFEKNHSRFNRAVLATHKENQGLGASRNTAFDLADTLNVMALDADNKLRPSCVSECLRAMDDAGAAFAYPTIQQFGDSKTIMGNRSFNPADFIPGNGVDAMAMISKEAWAMVGGYATHRRGWQDYDLWLRFIGQGLVGVHVPKILADYRVHQKSMLRTATDNNRNKLDLVERIESDHPWTSMTASRLGHRIVDR